MRRLASIFIISLLFTLFSCGKMNTDPEPVIEVNDRIIYSKNPKGYNELYKLENGIETLLISDPDFDYWWSKVNPNKSKMLVYRSPTDPSKNHDAYENAELVIANLDGSNIEVIIPKGANGWKSQGVARWNNDGTKILMCAEVDLGNTFQWRLIRTDSDGNNPIVLSDHWAIDCNFSNDNTQVVFMGFRDNQLSFDLTQLELQKGDYDPILGKVSNIESLTNNTTRDHDPDYSPDDTKLIFSAGNATYSNVDLVVFDLASQTEEIILDDESANGGSMSWSDDGNKIYFHSLNLLNSPFRIKCIDLETREITTILQSSDNSFGFFHPEAY